MRELTHISLFAGIGGIDLAAEWAGFKTILFVEIDPYCQKVLKKHWPDVPIIGDIKDVTKEKVKEIIANSNIRESRPRAESESVQEAQLQSCSDSGVTRFRQSRTAVSPVTLVTGGFPCQPVSQAGKRGGKADDRWLWPDMLRIISEVRSTWVVAENVTGLLTMGFYDCLSDLESAGYETIPFVIPACGVNAPHRRDRIFIVANSKCQRWGGRHNGDEGRGGWSLQAEGPSAGDKQADVAKSQGGRFGQELNTISDKLLYKDKGPQELESSSGNGANTERKRLEGSDTERAAQPWGCPTEYIGGNWWAVEPELGRVAYGIPNRVDRLKCLGNAVVPQQIYPILQAIADIENTIQN